jgi:hypothetical protein
MQLRAVTILLSGAIGILSVGCASTTPTMRGQSPQASFASWSSGPVMADGCPMCQSSVGPNGSVVHSGDCQNCPPGQGGCHNGCQTGCNLPFHPVHRNFHTYHVPQGLMYPPQNSAPAFYQYPYYTLRGPTDFFMK